MIKFYGVKLIILYAIFLQLITGGFVIFAPEKIYIARLGLFYMIFPNYFLGGAILIFAAILALGGFFVPKDFRFFYYFPQFLLLILTSGSALSAVFLQHYADGVIRPWWFIFLDQLPAFIGTVLYLFAIFDFKRDEITIDLEKKEVKLDVTNLEKKAA